MREGRKLLLFCGASFRLTGVKTAWSLRLAENNCANYALPWPILGWRLILQSGFLMPCSAQYFRTARDE